MKTKPCKYETKKPSYVQTFILGKEKYLHMKLNGSWPFDSIWKLISIYWGKSCDAVDMPKAEAKGFSIKVVRRCNLCRDALDPLYFLTSCIFLYYELNTMATWTQQRSIQVSLLKAVKVWSPSFQHHSHLSYTEDPLIGQANCCLCWFWEENTSFTEECGLLVFSSTDSG